MDDSTTQGAAAAFQAEDAEHVVDVDKRAAGLVPPECFQDQDADRPWIRPPAPPATS
jgi:hypothetical protein